MSEELRRTLDAQRRRLEEIDGLADDLLAGREVEVPVSPPRQVDEKRSFDEVVAVNEILRAERGWEDLLPTPPGSGPRRQWLTEDMVVVGLAGAVGFAAAWFDAPVDSWVRGRLDSLRSTDLIKGWEKQAKLQAIDHQGRGYGGPNHRVRGSGHDVLRFAAALRQIRSGKFEGVRWVEGVRVPEVLPVATPIESLPEALVLWLKHLATDVITPRSLPLPGWTLLNELPWPQAQTFARAVYMGERDGAPGLTLRSGVLQNLPVLSTEVIVRAHVHLRAMHERGSVVLTEEEAALRDEMLLVGHGITGAASLGRTVAGALSSEGPLSIRHLNVPVLLRVAGLGLVVARARTERLPEWSDLLDDLDAPWDLELAAEIEEAVRGAETYGGRNTTAHYE